MRERLNKRTSGVGWLVEAGIRDTMANLTNSAFSRARRIDSFGSRGWLTASAIQPCRPNAMDVRTIVILVLKSGCRKLQIMHIAIWFKGLKTAVP